MNNSTNKDIEIVSCRNSIAKHEQNIRKWNRMIQDAKSAIEYNNDKIKRLEGLIYYVYVVYVEGHPRYVGKGKANRYRHPVSGISSCPELNKDFFDNKYIEVMYAEKYMTEEKALKEESDWIGRFNEAYVSGQTPSPLYNKTIPEKFEYYDERIDYFYNHWFKHAVDNSDKEGVIIKRPAYCESVWQELNEESWREH